MEKKFYFNSIFGVVVSFFVAALVVGCNVDESYDLSNIDDSSMGIGTDATQFDIPLATVTLDVSEMILSGESDDEGRSGDDSSTSTSQLAEVFEVIENLSAFLPAEREEGIDLYRLDDEDYVALLIDELIGELSVSETKREDFCTVASNEGNEGYLMVIENYLDVTIDPDNIESSADALYEAIISSEEDGSLDEFKSAMKDEVKSEVEENSIESYTNFEEEYSVGSTGIDSSTKDILEKNVDGDNNTLIILAVVSDDLPLTIIVTPQIYYGGEYHDIGDLSDAVNSLAKITNIEQLSDILDDLNIRAVVQITNYDPRQGALDAESLNGKSIKISLVARKMGSIKL